jgi:hypothetical protein
LSSMSRAERQRSRSQPREKLHRANLARSREQIALLARRYYEIQAERHPEIEAKGGPRAEQGDS